MKKVALSLIALLAAGSFAFAEDVSVEKDAKVGVTLAASATSKLGIDLDHNTTGFANSVDYNLALTIVPESASSKTGSGDVYGTIEIASVKIYGDNEDGTGDDDAFALTLGDITAKIVAGNLYIKLSTNTDPAVDFAADGDDDNGGATIVADDAFYTYSGKYGAKDSEWTTGTIGAFSAFSGTGIEIGYKLPDLAQLTFGVASNGDWAANKLNAYETTAQVGLLAVPKLTLNVRGYVAKSTDKAGKAGKAMQQALGAELAYDLGVVTPFAHLNATGAYWAGGSDAVAAVYHFDTETGTAVQDSAAKAAVAATWDDDGAYTADFGAKLPLTDGFNAVAVATYTSASKVGFTTTIDLAQAKLAGPLGAKAGVRLGDLTSSTKGNKTTELFGQVNFDLGGGVGVWAKGSRYSTDADKSDQLFVKAGVDAAIFPLVTLGAEFDSSDLGSAESTKADASKNGQAYVYAKVAY